MTESPLSTPKRKRSEMLNDGLSKLDTSTHFTFDVSSAPDDDNASPRTCVAQRFRGLQLGGGGGDGSASDVSAVGNDDDGSRKRVKLPDVEMLDFDTDAAAVKVYPGVPPSTRQTQFVHDEGTPSKLHKSVRIVLNDSAEPPEAPSDTSADDNGSTVTPSLPLPSPPLSSHPQLPARNRTSKRAGTPPFPTSTAKTKTKPPTTSAKPTITDPLRASLTWHDDEITIYDPDDSDDDGTGINGIGFKPTPATAYARTVRRRQQLAEYKKREEKEARAKRSLRRRGGSPAPRILEIAGTNKTKGKGEPQRRVRFLDREGVGQELIGV
ncbi:hypothetical protein N657DRAFT_657538 [Parathielavia appendiculata]|uniref:Uncharacterized protein n=1 Tax=Parathielavia appendiculata TaxID=2587402 RepID=A0AAN6Z1G2_9PEZI|nr:hypothetical protein N657DRAFT_657538 [Parathielavia appendiculata]